jgi:predicted dehydrogenase
MAPASESTANSTTLNTWSRRKFLCVGAAASSAVSLVPSGLFGSEAPSGKLSLAGIGIGGVGFPQLQGCEKAGFQITALCDVDDVYAKKAYDQWPQARRYRDFRELLDSEGDKIDAVYVGTPDHTHAVIALAALRRKKHLCCVKPLTRTIQELRVVAAAARKAGVATQVTAAPNTSEQACRTCENIWGGAIGEVREVHIWSNRPLWPQGMTRPPGEDPVPGTFDWKLWLGPAPGRPFKNKWPEDSLVLQQIAANGGRAPASRGVYHPWNFRGWWDFGTGSLGDMGCHWFNTVFRALKLGAPRQVHATATRLFPESAPLGSIVTYDFPARSDMPLVRITWYDGGLKPARPLEAVNEPLPEEGVLYVGDKGRMLWDKVLPGANGKPSTEVPRTLPRRGGTWAEWNEACRGGEPAGCNFDWAGPLTETVLLGNVAIRTGQLLDWDAIKGKVTNVPAANQYIDEAYHNGWKLEA